MFIQKVFFVEINVYKKKWLSNSSCYPHHNSDIAKHLQIMSKSLDICSTKYENIVILDNFNAYVEDETLNTFCKSDSLNNLIKQRTFFKNPENPSCN